MYCLSLASIEHLVIWLILVSAALAITKLVLPLAGVSRIMLQILYILAGVCIAILVVGVVFDVLACARFPLVVR